MTKVTIIGAGCTKCRMLETNLIKAAQLRGMEIEIEKSRDINDYNRFRVTLVPALIIDGVKVSSGRILSVEELSELLTS